MTSLRSSSARISSNCCKSSKRWRTIFLRRCRRVEEMPQPHLPCAPHELQPPSAVVRSIEALRFTQTNRRFGHHMPLSKSIQETLHLRAARVHG
ncbi:hypothetical protein CLOM_g21014 [Closterium sp. NIES-68]|nr:hypothetical protein CLOM_g21014 [Closterium sp. NIES-68]